MQSLSIQVDDSYIEQFMQFVQNSHSKITIHEDPNLKIDPYYHERKVALQHIIDGIESGKRETVSLEAFESDIHQLTKEREKIHAN